MNNSNHERARYLAERCAETLSNCEPSELRRIFNQLFPDNAESSVWESFQDVYSRASRQSQAELVVEIQIGQATAKKHALTGFLNLAYVAKSNQFENVDSHLEIA